MVGLESPSGAYLDGRPVQKCSDVTEQQIDEEVMNIIKKQHQRSIQILFENRETVLRISQYLLEKETMTGEEFVQILEEET